MAKYPTTTVLLKNGIKLLIRNPKHEDAQLLVDYIQQVSKESNNLSFGLGESPFTKEQEEKYIESMKNDPHRIMAVGIVDGEIIAVGDISGPSLPRLRHSGDLGLSVKKLWWNVGVGTAILQYLIDWAKSVEKEKINLQVKEDNAYAIKLYEKMGFKEEGRISRGMYINEKFYALIWMGLQL
jgi:RimJ/RimL family protein N-acetyltransferase